MLFSLRVKLCLNFKNNIYGVHIILYFILRNMLCYLCSGWTGIASSNKFNELYVPQCKLYMEYCFPLILSLYE